MKRKMQINHLRNHYSDYVFLFIKRYIAQINNEMIVGDIGAGHLRNLKLFEELGFKNLYAVDKDNTDNPLSVNLKDFIKQDIEEKITFPDTFFDITLCNYVLMFIDPMLLNKVVNDLLRVTNKFIIIETNEQKYKRCKTTAFKNYSFNEIVNIIENNSDFEILELKKYYQKIIARRAR